MYKGKFDQKNKNSSVDVSEIVSQRNSAPAKKAPAKAPVEQDVITRRSAAQQAAPAAAERKPAEKKTAEQKAPAKKAAPQQAPEKKPAKKRGPRLGGVIFYTLYFMFILVFFVGAYFGLQWLQGWLVDYEAAQPTVKCQQVFNQLFADPDWGYLYDAAGVEGTQYEGREEYVAYMESKVGDSQLTFMETSAGLSGDKKYVVKLGNEKVAAFTLTGATEFITDIPEWQLGSIEVYFELEESYLIQKMDGHTVYVNDVPLTEDNTIQKATTLGAEKYLPEGTSGVEMCTQKVDGLMGLPTVTIFDESGSPMEVSYNEETRTFTEQTVANTITEEEQTVAREAAEIYCLWMIEETSDRAKIAKYFDTSSEAYSNIIRTTELWMQNHNGYRFVDETVTDYCRYTDDLFSVRVSLTLSVTRTDGTVKGYPFSQAMFFEKQDTGKWLCYYMTNVDVSQPVGQVRLTFMDGSTQLNTDFYATDAEEIITPILPAREGKVFTGWVRQDVDDNGVTTLTVVFQPDENGKVPIPSGTTLEPMTLYALFEDASGVTVETTEGA